MAGGRWHVSCELVEVHASWFGHHGYQKKGKKEHSNDVGTAHRLNSARA